MNKMVKLRVARKGIDGFQICSIPLCKLRLLAVDEHRFWRLDGDFLILESY